MKATDTISVNPSKTTLGHVESPSTPLFRSQILGVESSASQVDLLKLVFPVGKSGVSEFRKYEVPLRTLFATILIATGICLLTTLTAGSAAFAICTIAFGAFLALGLFTRPVMAGAAVYYCITGALSLRAGAPDLMVFSLMFGSLIFCITGAGKYSCDTLIRHSLIKSKRNKEIRRKENAMSYKAFHTVRI